MFPIPFMPLAQMPIQNYNYYTKKRLKRAERALLLVKETPSVLGLKQTKKFCEDCRDEAISLIEKSASKENVDMYCASSIFVAQSLLLSLHGEKNVCKIKNLVRGALRALDLAIFRSGDINWKNSCAELIEFASIAQSLTFKKNISLLKNSFVNGKDVDLPGQFIKGSFAKDIPRIDAKTLSVQEFIERYMNCDKPVIITNAINSWPASRYWKNIDYLKKRATGRLVPIEITSKEDAGRSFMASSWSHQFMNMEDYIEKYVSGESVDHGYLAQHPMFDQIPLLRDDIKVPKYCSARTKLDIEAPEDAEFAHEPLISAWFGGSGTVSPIHNDPYHNTLAQVFGKKYLRIYSTEVTHRLYPLLNHLGHNSQVDVDRPDYSIFPEFRDTPCWQGILSDGELLYIPRNAWHYVRSLTTCFSVSFWFGAKMELRSKKNGHESQYLRK
jgi:hypothetical protein